MLQACLSILLGYKVQGCRELYAERDEFVRRTPNRDGGIWIYALDIIVPTWVVAAASTYTAPTFEEGIVNMTDGASSESVSTEGQP